MTTIKSNNLICSSDTTRASSLPLSISGLGQSLPKSADNVKDSELRRVLAAQMERLSLSVCMVRLKELPSPELRGDQKIPLSAFMGKNCLLEKNSSWIRRQSRKSQRNHFKSNVTFFRLACFHATFWCVAFLFCGLVCFLSFFFVIFTPCWSSETTVFPTALKRFPEKTQRELLERSQLK